MSGIIAIIGGGPGSGKTMQCALYNDGCKKIFLDVENKSGVTINSLIKTGIMSGEGDIDIRSPIIYDKEYKIDHIATYQKLVSDINDIMKNNEFDVIVFDSVTHLRNSICANYHCAINNKKQVGEMAWRDVNSDVRRIIEPLVNYCRATGKTLLMTCHLKDEYQNNMCVGKMFDAKEFILHYCDATIMLESNPVEQEYTAVCTRSNAGGWVEDVSGKICLDMIFEEREMI